MKKKIALISLISVVTIIIIISFAMINKRFKEETFTSTYDEIIEKISKNSSTCSFEDYFKVVRAEYMILPDEHLIKHSFVFQNITGEDISFNYQVYKEQELIDKYISSLAPALPPNAIPIELPAENRAVASMASQFLYSYESFTEEEKDRIDELASKLYIEFSFDGKFDYFEVDLQKVDEFSKY